MDKSFFAMEADRVAEELLGCFLVHETSGQTLKGRIVETEAYFGKEDPGSHAYNGKTERTKLMFETYGKAYIYLCYGMYNLLNVTTGENSVGAVLIRALEPLEGIEKMKENREVEKTSELTDGPGKLTQAFNIDRELNGENLYEGDLRIERGVSKQEVVRTRRIGISQGKEEMLRFHLNGNKFVSV